MKKIFALLGILIGFTMIFGGVILIDLESIFYVTAIVMSIFGGLIVFMSFILCIALFMGDD